MMNTSSLKGAGNLSRKLIAILVVAAMPSLGYAVDNSIYIDQSGSFGNISITQDGAGNTVKGVVSNAAGQRTDAATLSGDNSQITINQIGSGNTLSISSQGSTMTGYRDTTINYSAVARDTQTLIINNGASNLIGITQTGNQSNVETRVIGGRNQVSINAAGTGDVVRAGIQGGDSTINVNLSNTGGSNTVTATTNSGSIGINADGTGNTFNVQQDGTGNSVSIAGYSSSNALVGNDNNVQIQQNGSSNIASLGITGSTNFVGINQANTGSGGQEASVKISGNSNTVNISQGVPSTGVGITAGSNFLQLPTRQ
jgi:hypothetical protein